MSTFKDVHITEDITIDGNIIGAGAVEVPLSLGDSSLFSNLISHCWYFPYIHACFFNLRVTRIGTLSVPENYADFIVATVPEQYTPTVSHAATIYAATAYADIYAYVSSNSNIYIHMVNGNTNPTYFYINGHWYLNK